MEPINGRRVMCAKDSMERMGDDLTEVIVSYLTFADRVRLECMSRQWRSFIYRKQFVSQDERILTRDGHFEPVDKSLRLRSL